MLAPEPRVVLQRHEGADLHPIELAHPVQMVDLVLEDARVPTGSRDDDGVRALVEGFDAHALSARHDGGEPLYAQAALEEPERTRLLDGEHRVDDHLERNGAALSGF